MLSNCRVLLIGILLFAISSRAESKSQVQSEKELYCRILSCQVDRYHKIAKARQTGATEYYEFSPRGFPGFPGRGMAALEMFYRPGGATKASANSQKREYDEVWTETSFADSKRVADIAYTYWLHGRFQVIIVYAVADIRYVPTALLNRTREPSALESFLYKLINGEWFVLDHVSDRNWFDGAVKSLN